MRVLRIGTVLTLLALSITGVALADEIRYSLSEDRSKALSLDGARVWGDVYFFLEATTPAAIEDVEFFLNDNFVGRDTSEPFDLVGEEPSTGVLLPFNTVNLGADSENVLEMRSNLKAGGTEIFSATFSAVFEGNHAVVDVKQAFLDLNQQGEWLGFYLENHVCDDEYRCGSLFNQQFELFPGSFSSHINGVARSQNTDGPPIFYASVSGPEEDWDSYSGIMVVEMNSLASHGERLGSNRLERGVETVYTLPNPGYDDHQDKVIEIIETAGWHPAGIAMVGDVLAVPMGNFIYFYDCRDPRKPALMDYALPLVNAHDTTAGAGSQGVAITKLPDGRFLLVTNGGGGAYFFFSAADKTSFFDVNAGSGPAGDWAENIFHVSADPNDLPEGFPTDQAFRKCQYEAYPECDCEDPASAECTENSRLHYMPAEQYRHLDKQYISDHVGEDYWPFKDETDCDNCNKGRTFQGVNFVNQKSADGERLFLIGSAHSDSQTPRLRAGGSNELYLLEVVSGESWECGEGEFPDCFPLSTLPNGLNLKAVTKHTDMKTKSPKAHNAATPLCIGAERWLGDFPNHYMTCGAGVLGPVCLLACSEKRWQGNFNAGAGAYVAPSGELLFYAASHFADGELSASAHFDQALRSAEFRSNDFVKLSEFSNTMGSADGTCGVPKFRANHLGGPYELDEGGQTLQLDGRAFMVEPWVRMYQDENFEGWSVMMDWATREDDDYDNLSLLDGAGANCRPTHPSSFRCAGSGAWCSTAFSTCNCVNVNSHSAFNGFNNCMTSFKWCGPVGSSLELHKTENYGSGQSWPLSGDGQVDSWANVGSGYNDRVSSVKLEWSGAESYYLWDLEGEGLLDWQAGSPEATYTSGVGSSTDTVFMELEGYPEVSAVINVRNVPPTVYLLGPYMGSSAYEGDEVVTAVMWWDPGASSVDLSVHWGDEWPASTLENQSGQSSGYGDFRHVGFVYRYADDSHGDEFSPLGCANDGEAESCAGEDPETNIAGLIVLNVPPSVAATGPQIVNEGSVLELGLATFSDPGTLDTHTATINWGDGTDIEAGLVTESPSGPPANTPTYGTVAGSHVYADDGAYTVTVTVVDDDNGVGTDSFVVQVENVDPTITSATNSAAACGDTPEDGLIEVSADFSDPGFDRASAWTLEDFDASEIDWGDGTIELASVDETPGQPGTSTTGTLSGSHLYATGGIYEIVVAVTDDDGGSGSMTLTALVTGAGLSPAGLLGIVGTDFLDVINIRARGGDIEVQAGFLSSEIGFAAVDVSEMQVLACDANDQIHVNHQILTPAILHGGPGPDHLRAGGGFTELIGDEGNDHLFAGDAGNVLDGGTGDDDLNGGNGNDILLGGPGDDRLAGGKGDDSLDGGADFDDCNPGQGNDTVLDCEK